MEIKTRIQIYVLIMISIGSVMIFGYQAYASGCYTEFTWNFFLVNNVLQCLDINGGGGSNDTSINNAVPISGSVIQRFPITHINSDYNMSTSDFVVICDASGGTVNVYLPNAIGISGNLYYVKESNISGGNCVVNAHIGTIQKIDGQSSVTLNIRTIIAVQSSSSNWEVINPVCSQDTTYINMCANGSPFTKEVSQTGDAIFVQDFGDHIKINNDGVWTINPGIGINVNQTQYNTLVSTNFANGTGISITGSTQQTVTNTSPESTVCSNSTSTTGHYGLCKNNTISLRTLNPSTGITMSINGTDVIISNSGIIFASCSNGITCSGTNPLAVSGAGLQNQETTVCSSAGGTTYVKTSSGGNCTLYGGTAGTGLTLTQNTNDNQYKTNFANGTGISITGSTTQTFTNTGVISNSCSSGISCSGTNPSSFTNTGVTSLSCSGLAITCSASTGAITITPLWQQLCTNTLNANASSLSCSSFTATKYILAQIEFKVASSGTAINPSIQFNSDTGSNYAYRVSLNGATDTTGVSQSKLDLTASTVASTDKGIVDCFIYNNLSSERKSAYCTIAGGLGSDATGIPYRAELSGKWSNTANQITTITLTSTNGGTAKYASGTEIVIWGHD